MARVSVITTTYRHGGVDIASSSLDRQTYKDFEWIFADRLFEKRKEAFAEYVKVPYLHIPEPDTVNPQLTSVPYTINRTMNEAVRRASGEYIVFFQDYIYLPVRAIERLVEVADEHPRTIVNTWGHKAELPDKLDHPRGLITTFKKPYTEKPTGISYTDPRMSHEMAHCDYTWTETNFCLIPKGAIYEVGGFEESFDNTNYGGDNTALGFKLNTLGYNFLFDGKNECTGFNQSLFPRPSDWEERHNNKGNYDRWVKSVLERGWKAYL